MPTIYIESATVLSVFDNINNIKSQEMTFFRGRQKLTSSMRVK